MLMKPGLRQRKNVSSLPNVPYKPKRDNVLSLSKPKKQSKPPKRPKPSSSNKNNLPAPPSAKPPSNVNKTYSPENVWKKNGPASMRKQAPPL